jgi:hypothetical protein
MTFFNKKEDVLKIELTPHGRKMLSEGKLKPMYYTFLDDDILYDASRGGISENNSETKNRILSETPYMKPQTNYKGVETELNNSDSKVEQVTYLQQIIGTNKQTEKRAAGWNITSLLDELESSVKALTGSQIASQQIPQIDFQLNYTMSVENQNDRNFAEQGLIFNQQIPTVIKNDGTYVDVEKEQLLLNIFERNGFFHKDSYELEVYVYEQDEINIDRKLKFFAQDNQIKNGMLIQETEDTIGTSEDIITEEFVEYYMLLNTDREIPEEDICKGLTRLKARDIYLDLEVRCPDRDDLEVVIYGSRIQEEDLEDC